MARTSEQKIIELDAKVKLLEKQKARAEHLAEHADKKMILFDMLINMAEAEYDIDIRKKIQVRDIENFIEEQKKTIVSTCNLLGLDRQVYYRAITSRS